MLLPHNENCKEQSFFTPHDSDTPDKIQEDLSISYVNSELEDHVFDYDSLCTDWGDTSIMLDIELHQPANLNNISPKPS